MRVLASVCLVAVWAWLGPAAAQPIGPVRQPLAGLEDPLLLARTLVARAEHGGQPFAVVDKRQAQLLVFDAKGVLVGRSAALLGRTLGDYTVPGVGLRTQQGRLQEADRTTPAGRFLAEPGRTVDGEAIVWIDYNAALAIHRLRNGSDHDNRRRLLAGSDPQARRVSAGCVVVSAAFYDQVVQPLLGYRRGLVVVMPEAQRRAQTERGPSAVF